MNAVIAAADAPEIGRDDDRTDARSLEPPENLLPNQWAEKYRVLSRRQSSRPGQWRNANAPPLAPVMDLAVRRTVREIWVKKAGQVGVSEAFRNVIGRNAHLAPAPAMLVLPNEKKGRDIVRKRIIPLFEDTDVLHELRTGRLRDKKLQSITLANGFELSLAWAGSPAAMASDPFQDVYLDEVDKFEADARQVDPVGEARIRIKTYGDRGKLIAMSTPSTSDGRIAVGYSECSIHLFFFGSCPHCGRVQRIIWDRVAFEKFADLPDAKSRAARIKARGAAWLECENSECPGGRIGENPQEFQSAEFHGPRRILERDKRSMLQGGYWGTEDGTWKLYCDGREEGEQPEGDTVGIHYPDLIDLETTWADDAAAYVRADGNAVKLQEFYNLRLGEEFKHRVEAAPASVFSKKCSRDDERGFLPPPARVVPRWASRLVLTVDTQADSFWWIVRAWGQRFRSQRIDHGQCKSFDELEEILDRSYYPYELVDGVQRFPAIRPFLCGIDSGGGIDRDNSDATRTDQVYRWSLKDPRRRFPLKGSSRPMEDHIRWRDVTYRPANEKRSPYTVHLHLIDSLYWRDLLASYITATLPVFDATTGEIKPDETVDQWMLNDRNDAAYNRHMSNVHRVRLKKGRGHVDLWQPITGGARHDYHDLEAYQLAMAHGPARCHALPSPEQRAADIAAERAAAAKRPSGITTPDGRPFLATQR